MQFFSSCRAFHQDSSKLERPVMPGSDSYFTIKNDIIKAERRVLKELGFCVHLNHPHKLIVSFLHLMKLVGNKDLLQAAWACMNDSLRTDVFLRFQSSIIACACLHLAAAKTGQHPHDPWPSRAGSHSPLRNMPVLARYRTTRQVVHGFWMQ
eukprot:TRINITY_DN11434_c0_g1_i10.p1 TRINITY_DN11434_c0_g1~~TRINITY_DN11434_c0_g1_i10.p1  ORF type:complete len:152 (+),score=5.28 TRINITY_DN11434_c0_g1_i10:57-512(+)